MKQRVISAVVLCCLFIPILLIGKIPFAIFVALLSCLGVYEIFKNIDKKNVPFFLKIITYILVCLITLNPYKSIVYIDYRIIIIVFLIYTIPIIFTKNINKWTFNDSMFLVGVTLFLGIGFNNFIFLRNLDINYIIYLLIITITTDSFAYIVGGKIGKNKLAPKTSPNKTIEGSIGGSLMGTILSSMFFIEIIGGVNVYLVIAISLFLTIIGQVGDLVFSAIKRNYNIKDFSNLIPGHGGVLDRLDSLLFVCFMWTIIISIL